MEPRWVLDARVGTNILDSSTSYAEGLWESGGTLKGKTNASIATGWELQVWKGTRLLPEVVLAYTSFDYYGDARARSSGTYYTPEEER